MSNDNLLLAKAFKYAAEKHTDQRRKGPRAEPYINHPADVAFLLAKHTDGKDVNLIIAGLLHDVVEDTDGTLEEIEREFNKDVAFLVSEVSDDKSLPKERRKELQIEHAAHASDRGKMLKIADKIVNLTSLTESAPADWETRRISEYFNWAKRVVDQCRNVNPGLEKDFDDAFAAGQRKYKF